MDLLEKERPVVGGSNFGDAWRVLDSNGNPNSEFLVYLDCSNINNINKYRITVSKIAGTV